MRERIARADVVFFDGTLFRDDEMIASGTGTKTGRRMGHMPIDGDDGSLAALADVAARRIYVHINNTNPILVDGSPERAHVERSGLGGRRGRHGDRAVKLMTPQELEAQLRDIGARRYHRLHPFHALLHGGKCTKGQVQAWALNRYYYQAMIPVKDASLIARCDDSGAAPGMAQPPRRPRRRERGRRRHRALAQADRRARARPRLRHLARGPAARRRASRSRPTCTSCARRSLLEAVASSLTELFSPQIIGERIEGMLKSYDFVSADTLAYFSKRPPQAQRDSDFALDYVKRNAKTPDAAAGGAARRSNSSATCCGRCSTRCHHAYVAPKHISPGAFVPKE